MNSKLKNSDTDFLFKAILSLENEEECYRFFEDLCTSPELKAMSQRLVVAKMLTEKKVYSEIVKETGASTATISRVKRALFDNDKELCSTITIDDVLDACDELSEMLHRCFYGGEDIEGYFYQLMLQGDYIGKYDELFRSFITRNFDIVDMQPEEQFDTQSEEGNLK